MMYSLSTSTVKRITPLSSNKIKEIDAVQCIPMVIQSTSSSLWNKWCLNGFGRYVYLVTGVHYIITGPSASVGVWCIWSVYRVSSGGEVRLQPSY